MHSLLRNGFHSLPADSAPIAPESRVHGQTRTDGKVFDTRLPYGGGWVTPAQFADRK